MAANAIELTRELVGYDTVNPPGNELACLEHLGRLLEPAGFRLDWHPFGPGRANLVAHSGGSEARPPLCFTGHVDTVPLGQQPWSVDPFAGEIADGRLYGRGSSDMKSGVAAFVLAACDLAPRLAGTPGLVLVITAGEEAGCQGAFDLARREGALGRAGAIIVAEPTENRPLLGHKGAFWLTGIATGITAHGSMPDKGVNAIYKAARAIAALEAFDFDTPPHPIMGPPTLNVGTVSGGININSVPDRAEFGIDIRSIPGQHHRDVRRALERRLGADVALETIIDFEGVWTEPEVAWAAEVFEVTREVTGRAPAIEAAPYFTDASALTPAMGGPPTVILGPGEAALAHQTDEYCRLARIEEAVALFSAIARRWCET
ncbi:MAG TPA: M20 family metallopeptidase [Afifellaceae bacterium]|nr:M20 family metallopeptidase [Afifellaceae bacterium]